MARILIVDDEPLIREEAAEALRLDGHNVVQAGDGREAMRLLDAVPVDIVILDIYMPHKDGLETIREIRRLDGAMKHVKIITISNGGGQPDPLSCLEYSAIFGSDYALPKPFSLAELRATVGNVAAG